MKPSRHKSRSRSLIIITAVLVCISIIYVVPYLGRLFTPLGDILTPVERFLYRTKVATRDFWYYISQDTDNEIRTLHNENERLYSELSQMSIMSRENEALRAELQVQRSHKRQVALAHVIGEKPGSFSRFLILDIGTNQGLRVGLPIILNNALVGKIEKVSEHSAEMSLVTDPKAMYYSYLQKAKSKGLIQGTIGLGLLHMTQIPRTSVITKGDLVFTTGQELENFNDILVGTVNEIISNDQDTYLTLLVSPAVETTNIDTVFVVIN